MFQPVEWLVHHERLHDIVSFYFIATDRQLPATALKRHSSMGC